MLPVWAAIGAVSLFFSGCASDSSTTQAELQIADVQGTSFDEPVTTAPAATGSPTNAELVLATPGPVTSQPATAADVPLDIASIPSATPVPRAAAPPTVAGGNPAPQPLAKIDAGSYEPVPFTVLAGYKYVEPLPVEGAKPEDTEKLRKKDQIPVTVAALNGKNAVVEGWMVPMEVDDDGGVKSFVLVKTQPQCCFGDTQSMNEWVDVSMDKGRKAEFNVDRPIRVFGSLEVGEKMEDGFVLSIYRMKAEKVEG